MKRKDFGHSRSDLPFGISSANNKIQNPFGVQNSRIVNKVIQWCQKFQNFLAFRPLECYHRKSAYTFEMEPNLLKRVFVIVDNENVSSCFVESLNENSARAWKYLKYLVTLRGNWQPKFQWFNKNSFTYIRLQQRGFVYPKKEILVEAVESCMLSRSTLQRLISHRRVEHAWNFPGFLLC